MRRPPNRPQRHGHRQRAHASHAQQNTLPVCADLEYVNRERGHHLDIGHAEETVEERHAYQKREHRVPTDVFQSLHHVPHRVAARGLDYLGNPQHEYDQGHNYESSAGQEEYRRGPGQADYKPRRRGRDYSSALPDRRIQSHGAHHYLAVYQVRIECLVRGLSKSVHRARDEGNRYDVPHLYYLEQRQGGEQKYERCGTKLSNEYEHSLVQPVRKHPANQGERNRGRGVRKTNVSQVQRRPCQLKDQPTLPEHEHLEAAHRRQSPKPVGPVLWIPESWRYIEQSS